MSDKRNLAAPLVEKEIVDQTKFRAKEAFPVLNSSTTDSGFIDERELLKRLPVSRRTLFTWRASGKLPFVNVGGRRNLYHWPSVKDALLRMQQGGRK
jgi:hypothetical protein